MGISQNLGFSLLKTIHVHLSHMYIWIIYSLYEYPCTVSLFIYINIFMMYVQYTVYSQYTYMNCAPSQVLLLIARPCSQKIKRDDIHQDPSNGSSHHLSHLNPGCVDGRILPEDLI